MSNDRHSAVGVPVSTWSVNIGPVPGDVVVFLKPDMSTDYWNPCLCLRMIQDGSPDKVFLNIRSGILMERQDIQKRCRIISDYNFKTNESAGCTHMGKRQIENLAYLEKLARNRKFGAMKSETTKAVELKIPLNELKVPLNVTFSVDSVQYRTIPEDNILKSLEDFRSLNKMCNFSNFSLEFDTLLHGHGIFTSPRRQILDIGFKNAKEFYIKVPHGVIDSISVKMVGNNSPPEIWSR